jgi:hypothetical protein
MKHTYSASQTNHAEGSMSLVQTEQLASNQIGRTTGTIGEVATFSAMLESHSQAFTFGKRGEWQLRKEGKCHQWRTRLEM